MDEMTKVGGFKSRRSKRWTREIDGADVGSLVRPQLDNIRLKKDEGKLNEKAVLAHISLS